MSSSFTTQTQDALQALDSGAPLAGRAGGVIDEGVQPVIANQMRSEAQSREFSQEIASALSKLDNGEDLSGAFGGQVDPTVQPLIYLKLQAEMKTQGMFQGGDVL